jgi:hypothetical protein
VWFFLLVSGEMNFWYFKYFLLSFFQGWCGKNHSGKYRVVFTGFYQQINPRSGKYWEI